MKRQKDILKIFLGFTIKKNHFQSDKLNKTLKKIIKTTKKKIYTQSFLFLFFYRGLFLRRVIPSYPILVWIITCYSFSTYNISIVIMFYAWHSLEYQATVSTECFIFQVTQVLTAAIGTPQGLLFVGSQFMSPIMRRL